MLDKWLAGPRDLVPGAKMPVRFADPKLRANVIRYLQSLGQPAPVQGAVPDAATPPKG
jgi:cytochrome c2